MNSALRERRTFPVDELQRAYISFEQRAGGDTDTAGLAYPTLLHAVIVMAFDSDPTMIAQITALYANDKEDTVPEAVS